MTLEALFSEADQAISRSRLENYEIIGEIGRGGMGVISRTRQRNSERIVAIKRLPGYHTDSTATVARFRREAAAAAILRGR